MTRQQIRALAPFAAIGVACVVGGGVVAAAIAPGPTEHGVWAVAYLVLVAGVGQIVLGVGQALLAPQAPSSKSVLAEVAAWNAGNALVLAGAILGATAAVDAGGVLLFVVLALVAWHIRGHIRSLASARADAGQPGSASQRWLAYAFLAVLLLLLVSIPAGLVLERVGPT